MKTFIKENTWLSGMTHGWGNGYVIIPKGHPAHGVHYDDINVSVHGGLTFSAYGKEISKWEEISEEDKEGWIVGFDTAHLYDNQEDWTKEAVEEETNNLANQLMELNQKPKIK